MLATDAGGAAKIMDFGIARMSDTRTATPTGMVMGTLEYMAPEQIKGEPVDGRADQFSLAAVAYEMLTGNTLFGEQRFATLAYKIVNEMPVPPRTYNPGLPEGVDEVMARGLRKPPAERFQTCGGFVAALERAFAGEIPPTGQLTQAMFVAPLAGTAAPPPVPIVPMPMAAPPAPTPTVQGSAPLAHKGQASTTAPLAQMASAPPAPGPARRGALIGIAGVLTGLVLGGGLLLWKPWVPHPAQPQEPAAVPGLPVPVAGKADASDGKAALPHVSPNTPAKSNPNPTPVSPLPPQAQSSQAHPQPQPPPPPSPTSAAVEPKPTPLKTTEPANDTAPGSAVPSEPDAAEGPIPQPARASFREGESLVKADKYPAAIQAFTKAIDIKPDFLRAYFARGAAYLHLNRPADAFADYTELLRRNPRSANALAQRGICHSRLHDENAALADFNQALEIRPNIPGALNGRGLIFFHRKQYQRALHEFTEAIRVSPDFSFAYVNRAHTEEAMGNQAAAEADLKKAKDLGLAVK
jgi:Flp pilus assembly protein TadD